MSGYDFLFGWIGVVTAFYFVLVLGVSWLWDYIDRKNVKHNPTETTRD